MAGKLGALVIEIVATTAKLRQSMTASERIVKKSTRAMSKAAKAARKSINAIGIGAGVGTVALAAMVKQTKENVDATAKFADVIGLTTEQLTGYQLAAKITGSEIGQLNTGLTRLQKNIADAEAGLATPIREFERLGIAAEELRGLSTDEQIKLIADRFQDLPSTIDRAAVALNLFGRSGVNLSKLLNEGSEGIERLQQEAIDLGIAFNRIDAAKIEEANDAMTRAKALSEGFSIALTTELSPVISAMANDFADAGKAAGGFGELARDGIDGLATGVGVLADGLHGVEIIYASIIALATELAAVTVGTSTALQSSVLDFANTSLGKIGIEFEGLEDAEKLLGNVSVLLDRDAAQAARRLQDLLAEELPSTGIENALTNARAQAEKTAKAIADAQGVAVDGGDSDEPPPVSNVVPPEVLERLREAKQIYEDTRTPLEAYRAEIERITALNESGAFADVGGFETYQRAIQQTAEDYNELVKTAEETGEELSTFADQAARNMQDAFADFLFDPFDEGIDGLLNNFVRILQRMAAEAAAAQIFDFIGGGGGGEGGGGDIFSALLSSFDGGGFTGSGPRIGGVDGKGGFLSVVHPNETVIDHTKGQAVGGVTIGSMVFPGVSNQREATLAAGAAGRELTKQLNANQRYS